MPSGTVTSLSRPLYFTRVVPSMVKSLSGVSSAASTSAFSAGASVTVAVSGSRASNFRPCFSAYSCTLLSAGPQRTTASPARAKMLLPFLSDIVVSGFRTVTRSRLPQPKNNAFPISSTEAGNSTSFRAPALMKHMDSTLSTPSGSSTDSRYSTSLNARSAILFRPAGKSSFPSAVPAFPDG